MRKLIFSATKTKVQKKQKKVFAMQERAVPYSHKSHKRGCSDLITLKVQTHAEYIEFHTLHFSLYCNENQYIFIVLVVFICFLKWSNCNAYTISRHNKHI